MFLFLKVDSVDHLHWYYLGLLGGENSHLHLRHIELEYVMDGPQDST